MKSMICVHIIVKVLIMIMMMTTMTMIWTTLMLHDPSGRGQLTWLSWLTAFHRTIIYINNIIYRTQSLGALRWWYPAIKSIGNISRPPKQGKYFAVLLLFWDRDFVFRPGFRIALIYRISVTLQKDKFKIKNIFLKKRAMPLATS